MKEPEIIRLVAPNGERRVVDVNDLTEMDRIWILESFPDAHSVPPAFAQLGYVLVNVEASIS